MTVLFLPSCPIRLAAALSGTFDTMITITACAEAEHQFKACVDAAETRFTESSGYYDSFAPVIDIENITYKAK